MRAWEIVLLAVGSPLWITLTTAAFVVLLAIYAVLWAMIVALWAIFGAVIAASTSCITGGILLICYGHIAAGLALIGCSLFCAGLSILLFFGCLRATVGAARLTRLILLGIKKCFVRKEKEA